MNWDQALASKCYDSIMITWEYEHKIEWQISKAISAGNVLQSND